MPSPVRMPSADPAPRTAEPVVSPASAPSTVSPPTAVSRRAPEPTQQREAEMDADVEAIARRLKEQVLTAAEEREVLATMRKWSGTPGFDRFVTKLRIRVITRATARSAWMNTSVNLFDTLFHELEDDRLAEFQRLLASSQKYSGAKPEGGPSENVWATVGRQELIGLFGLMKGLSAGLAGVGDTAVWVALKQANVYLAPFGMAIKDPASLAGWVEKQLDISGDYLFDGGFTGGEELFLGQNAASIGKAGGSVIWNLVMLHGGGAGSVAKPGLGAAIKAHDVVAAFKGVDDALTSMGDYLLRMQAAGTLTREHLLRDDAFKVEAFKVAGALTEAMGQGLGIGGEEFAKVVQVAMEKLGKIFKAGEIGAKFGRISQLLMDDSMPPAQQRKAVGDVLMELVSDAFAAVGAEAAKVDTAQEKRRRAAASAPQQQQAPPEPEPVPEAQPQTAPPVTEAEPQTAPPVPEAQPQTAPPVTEAEPPPALPVAVEPPTAVPPKAPVAKKATSTAKRDDRRQRRQFREWVAKAIMAGGDKHPLRKLLDTEGRPFAAGNMYDFDQPIFDAGHTRSHHGGGVGMGVEWSADNRLDGAHSEGKGVILEKAFVDVAGVPIERGMLQTMENHGLVPPGTVAAAQPSTGWVPPEAD